MSFANEVLSTVFKVAQIKPLLKKDGLDKDKPANCRSISNLNTISKVLEKLYLKRLKQQHSITARHKPIPVRIQTKTFDENCACHDHERCPREHRYLVHSMLHSPWNIGCFSYHQPRHSRHSFQGFLCLRHSSGTVNILSYFRVFFNLELFSRRYSSLLYNTTNKKAQHRRWHTGKCNML